MVGISKYEHLNKLNNPVNDAEAIAKALLDSVESEHDIVSIFDCHSFALKAAWKQFVAMCLPGDYVIIFFAGHGCAFKNHQCLLARGLTGPEKTTFNDGNPQRIEESSLQVDKMLATLRQKHVTKHLVLLDCCREFRVADIPRALNEKWGEEDKGSFNVRVGNGTVIGYATSPGDYASDGECSDEYRGKTGHGKTIL